VDEDFEEEEERAEELSHPSENKDVEEEEEREEELSHPSENKDVEEEEREEELTNPSFEIPDFLVSKKDCRFIYKKITYSSNTFQTFLFCFYLVLNV